jgi:hypothetical protein
MSDFDDAVNGLRAHRPQYVDPRIKVTGYRYPDGSVSNDPTTGARPGYLWVYGYPRPGANTQVIAGTRINPRVPNVKVWVGQNHANQAVAFDVVTDENAIRQFGGAVGAASTPLIPIEQWTQPVPGALIGGGRVLPSALGGYNVFVEGLIGFGYDNNDLPVDAGDIPPNPNEHCWSVWFMPLYTGTPVVPTYLTTTPVTVSSVNYLLVSDAYNLALPAGATRLGAVSLSYGQVTITGENSRFVDLRRDFAPEGLAGITVDDGATTLTGIDTLNFTSGATVSAGTPANVADIAITGGGGGGAVTQFQQQIAGVGGQAYFEFTSIPNTGTSLTWTFTGRTTNGANQDVFARAGTGGSLDTGSNYDFQRVTGNNATAGANRSAATTAIVIGSLPGTGVGAGPAGSIEGSVRNYTTSFWKSLSAECMYPSDASGGVLALYVQGEWRNTGAIDILRIYPGAGNFVQDSICTLYIVT